MPLYNATPSVLFGHYTVIFLNHLSIQMLTMVVTHGRAMKKPSGGRLTANRQKRMHEKGSLPGLPKVAEKKVKVTRMRGGKGMLRLRGCDVVNVTDLKTKKQVKAKIKLVSDNAANRHFVRRNVLTKGSIIETDKGQARITNRPGREGVVNAVLVK